MKTPKAMGSEKPGIVAVTVLLTVTITDTVPEPEGFARLVGETDKSREREEPATVPAASFAT
jgi:hypothetical protein